MPNTRRLADIPELTSIIASFLPTSDLARLARVSQHFFRTAGPLIWREVPNIGILMRLVRETKIRRTRQIETVTLPLAFTQVVSFVVIDLH